MNWIKNNIEPLALVGLIALIVALGCALGYYSNKEADDPKVLRSFRITLITGEKKDVSYWMNKDSKVSIYAYRGSYSLEYTWHSKLGWNIKRAKPGVIDFEEITNTNYEPNNPRP